MMSVGFSATVTVSCGIAAYQPDNYKSSFKQADSALYLANKVVKILIKSIQPSTCRVDFVLSHFIFGDKPPS